MVISLLFLCKMTHYKYDSLITQSISISGFIQASLSKIKAFFKDFSRLSYSFQGLKVYEKSWFKC